MNPTKRCYVCKQLRHLRKNCRIRDKVDIGFEKGKENISHIKTQMRQKWVRKSPDNSNQTNEESSITQNGELGRTTISK